MGTTFYRTAAFILLMLLPLPELAGQPDRILEAIAVLTGAEDIESLESSEVEMYESLLEHPLDLNRSSRARLLSSGLFTPFQVASLLDSRDSGGEILSLTELSLLPGFSPDFVRSLAPFVRLTSHGLPGRPPDDSIPPKSSFLTRTALRNSDFSWGVKAKTALGDLFSLCAAASSSYNDGKAFPPSAWGLSASFSPGKGNFRLIAGDFNARFGQGLVLWSGMSMSGFSTLSSFWKRPAGLSQSWSYSGTGTHRGLAADFRAGRFVLSSFISFPGLRDWCQNGKPPRVSVLPALNLTWYGKNGQLGLSAFWQSETIGGTPNGLFYQAGGKVSTDGRWNWKGCSLWWEGSLDCFSQAFACVGGISLPLGGDWRIAAVARLYPSEYSTSGAAAVHAWTKVSDEAGVAIGIEKRKMGLTLDLARKWNDPSVRQAKLLLKCPVKISDCSVLSLRISERFRPYEEVLVHRLSARVDLDWSTAGISPLYGESDGDAWKARFRLEGLHSRSFAALSYIEAGRKSGGFSAYLRGTVFFIDNWDDRIYSYERDAPGSFNVPAYYGRGVCGSAVCSAKFVLGGTRRRRTVLRIYSRLSILRYPFMTEPRSSATEFKLQAAVEI
ncbi:MAG: hypothetical protein ACI399_00685 [Candidatus Cryptobacteroides sp.]